MSFPRWFNEKLIRTCRQCGKKFYPIEWISKKRIYKESEKRYCTKIFCNSECRANYLEERNPEENFFYGKHLRPWNKGKRRDWIVKQTSGYVRIIKKDGSIDYQHRIAVNCSKGMIVHHKDGNKSNNQINNLEVMTQEKHIKLHKIHAGRTKSLAVKSLE